MSAQTGGGWDTAVETQDQTPAGGTKPQGGGSILIDQSERIVATIGSGYLQNFLSGGSVGSGIGVLTQKRFYYKGRNFSGTGKGAAATTEEGVVSIEDVTFTRFSFTSAVGFLITAILLAVAGFLTLQITGDYGWDEFEIGAILAQWAAALFFFVKYFINRHSLFLIAFPGGSFGFNVRYYPASDIRDFQRQLHLLKDHIKEGGDA